MMAPGRAPAQDEILKNADANHAFANFEIAADGSLLVIGDAAGQQGHRTAFQPSLKAGGGHGRGGADAHRADHRARYPADHRRRAGRPAGGFRRDPRPHGP